MLDDSPCIKQILMNFGVGSTLGASVGEEGTGGGLSVLTLAAAWPRHRSGDSRYIITVEYSCFRSSSSA